MANCLQLHRAGLDDVSRVFTQSVIGVGVSTVLRGDGSSCGGLPQLTREFLRVFVFFVFSGTWRLVGTASSATPGSGLITERRVDQGKQPPSLTLCVAGGPELLNPLEGGYE